MDFKYYKLVGHDVVPSNSIEWATKSGIRNIAKSKIDGVEISTVFLGLNHQFGDGPPLVFETMIFGGKHDQWQERCSTYDEAVAMHKQAVDLVGKGN
jgi:hypothetical protein